MLLQYSHAWCRVHFGAPLHLPARCWRSGPYSSSILGANSVKLLSFPAGGAMVWLQLQCLLRQTAHAPIPDTHTHTHTHTHIHTHLLAHIHTHTHTSSTSYSPPPPPPCCRYSASNPTVLDASGGEQDDGGAEITAGDDAVERGGHLHDIIEFIRNPDPRRTDLVTAERMGARPDDLCVPPLSLNSI
jgi:hypothetical protein